MHSCSHANYNKMTEMGNELMQLKGSPEPDQIPLREKFHLLEDEQFSIDNIIRKLHNRLNPEEKHLDFLHTTPLQYYLL